MNKIIGFFRTIFSILIYCWPHLLLIGVFIGLIYLWQYLFSRFFHINFLNFYIKNGDKLNFGLAILGFAIDDLNKRPNLISASPIVYFFENMKLFSVTMISLGRTTSDTDYDSLFDRKDKDAFDLSIGLIFDVVCIILFMIVLILVFVVYLLLFMPVQYFVFLAFGSYSRYTTISKPVKPEIEYYDGYSDRTEIIKNVFQEKPFSLTTSIVAFAFTIFEVVS